MKKMIIVCIIWCLICFSQTTFAQEAGDYNSNGDTTFFGVYEYPKEESSNPSPNDQIGDLQVNETGNRVLPSTGSDYFSDYQSSGFFALLLAIMIIIKRRKKHEKDIVEHGYFIN